MQKPLDDLWEKWGAEDEFMESSLQDCTWNNVKYGVPFNITSVCLLYNEDMYKEAGITEAPTTLEELREVSKNLPILQKVSMVLHATQIHGDYSELLLQKATI
ncbi:MAG: extracellular solute-binding protein [Blautia massiliensis (ex Durand et al. 2017)]